MSIAATIEESLGLAVTANWGKNPELETQQLVALYLLTPLGSQPYHREMGTDLVTSTNLPYSGELQARLSVQIRESFASLNADHSGQQNERRAVARYEDITFDETGRKQGDLGVTIKYYSIAALQRGDLNPGRIA
jgi:hypothetical protein